LIGFFGRKKKKRVFQTACEKSAYSGSAGCLFKSNDRCIVNGRDTLDEPYSLLEKFDSIGINNNIKGKLDTVPISIQFWKEINTIINIGMIDITFSSDNSYDRCCFGSAFEKQYGMTCAIFSAFCLHRYRQSLENLKKQISVNVQAI